MNSFIGTDFNFKLSFIKTWVSAASTNDNTFMKGLGEEDKFSWQWWISSPLPPLLLNPRIPKLQPSLFLSFSQSFRAAICGQSYHCACTADRTGQALFHTMYGQ
ncbi:hypothetical protein MKW92_030406 [Papaver armeniacum]|nr:hypothetical protein MKW92_030406 [Papaver armeniacum]